VTNINNPNFENRCIVVETSGIGGSWGLQANPFKGLLGVVKKSRGYGP
jgi:hypothetical protein